MSFLKMPVNKDYDMFYALIKHRHESLYHLGCLALETLYPLKHSVLCLKN